MMSEYDRRGEKIEKPNPLLPVVGFILLVGFGGFAYVIAPTARRFAETRPVRLGSMQVFPMEFPADWPDVAINGAIALIIFLVLFGIGMVIALAVVPSRRVEDAAGKWVEEDVKERKKRRGY